MRTGGKYATLFIEGFFIKGLDCHTDGTRKISECREGVLGDLLKEEKGGYSALFCSLDGVPVRVLFPERLIEDRESLFSCSLERDYRISGTLELEIGRGTGAKDYYMAARAFSSAGKRTGEKKNAQNIL